MISNYGKKKALIVCGPTASGKSDLALELALKEKALIVNIDAMQMYKGLEILSASPSLDMLEKSNHLMYNFLEPFASYNVANYFTDLKKIIDNHDNFIFVGGSGMYIHSLVSGIADIPEIKPEIRQNIRTGKQESEALYQELQNIDPDYALIVNKNDIQRISRALEVIQSTGESILTWQKKNTKVPFKDLSFNFHILLPDRDSLYENCNRRFLKMLEAGAIKEVEQIIAQGISPENREYQIFNTLGAKEIYSYIKGMISYDQMILQAQIKTRQYAKRQYTWFRRIKNSQEEYMSKSFI